MKLGALDISRALPVKGRRLDDHRLEDRVLYYLGTRRSHMTLSSTDGARVRLVGGPPFPEPILMWWNFVARTPDQIREARADWEAHRRFGDVPASEGPRLPAPDSCGSRIPTR